MPSAAAEGRSSITCGGTRGLAPCHIPVRWGRHWGGSRVSGCHGPRCEDPQSPFPSPRAAVPGAASAHATGTRLLGYDSSECPAVDKPPMGLPSFHVSPWPVLRPRCAVGVSWVPNDGEAHGCVSLLCGTKRGVRVRQPSCLKATRSRGAAVCHQGLLVTSLSTRCPVPWLLRVACLLLEVMCVYGEHGVKVHRGLSLCLSTRSTMVCDQVSRPLTFPLVGPPCPPTATEAKWSSFGRFSCRTPQSESKVKGGGGASN